MPLLSKRSYKINKSTDTTVKAARPTRDFSAIMEETTHAMPRHQQLFSRFVHAKSVSYAGDFLSKTIARPNAILFGAVLSFGVTIAVYLLSKNFGYSLSGFESIGSFIIGWMAGILFDLLMPILKNKK